MIELQISLENLLGLAILLEIKINSCQGFIGIDEVRVITDSLCEMVNSRLGGLTKFIKIANIVVTDGIVRVNTQGFLVGSKRTIIITNIGKLHAQIVNKPIRVRRIFQRLLIKGDRIMPLPVAMKSLEAKK